MTRTFFKDCRYLIARPDRREVIRGGGVLVEGTDILAVGASADVAQIADTGVHDVVDCSGKIVMPGFVNGHNHSPWSVINLVVSASSTSGVMPPQPSDLIALIEETVLAPMAWFDADNTYDLAMCGLMDQLRHGTTTTADANNVPSALYRAARDSGIRSVVQPQMLTSIMIEGLDAQGYLAQAEQCIRDYHIGGVDRVTVAVHPSWPWNCSADLLVAGMDLAKRYDVQFATHLYELEEEKRRANEIWADRGGALGYLDDLGLLDPRSIFFHGIELDRADIAFLAEKGCALVHNPELNAELFARVANVPAWLESGIDISLGTDYGQFDMFTAMKLAGLLPQMVHGGAAIDPWTLIQMATIRGAKAMRLDHKVGSLEVGKRADIITIDLRRNSGLVPLCDDPDWLAAMITRQSTRTEVVDCMVDGALLRRDGAFTMLDEEEITGKAQDWCLKFVSDYGQMVQGGTPWHQKGHPMFERA